MLKKIKKTTEYQDRHVLVQVILFRKGNGYIATRSFSVNNGSSIFGNPRSDSRVPKETKEEAIAVAKKEINEELKRNTYFNRLERLSDMYAHYGIRQSNVEDPEKYPATPKEATPDKPEPEQSSAGQQTSLF